MGRGMNVSFFLVRMYYNIEGLVREVKRENITITNVTAIFITRQRDNEIEHNLIKGCNIHYIVPRG